MKKNDKLGFEELNQLIAEKLNSVKLNDEQLKTYELLRVDFPRMPEFMLKKVIAKHPNADIEKLKKKAAKKRDCKRKKLGMMCMKKMMHCKSKSPEYEKFGHGPHGHWGKGPHGHGPHGFGPHGHFGKGPHGFGPYGKGPHHDFGGNYFGGPFYGGYN